MEFLKRLAQSVSIGTESSQIIHSAKSVFEANLIKIGKLSHLVLNHGSNLNHPPVSFSTKIVVLPSVLHKRRSIAVSA